MPRSLHDWLEIIQKNHPDTVDLGLERVSAVWNRMGCPQPAQRVITVAGTNGKGSTVAGIEAGLLFLGWNVACYTSPHLEHYSERIRINGRHADEASIIGGFETVSEAQGSTRLTYFEFATLAAIATMSKIQPDVAILEVGLGGRLDAVNVIDADLGVITTIGIDHQQYLGNDRESIGREKAGIMRPKQVVVCSDRQPPASIIDIAEVLGVSLIRLGADYEVTRTSESEGPGRWQFFFGNESTDFPVHHSAAHLADNLSGAMMAVLLTVGDSFAGLNQLASVIANTRLKGRLEQVANAPDIILDVGHNPLAAEAINDFLLRDGRSGCLAVVAMLEDKDAEGVAKALGDCVSHWYCAGLEGQRGQSGDKLVASVRSALPGSLAESHENVTHAIESALHDATDEDTVLVFGSFLTVTEARKFFESRG